MEETSHELTMDASSHDETDTTSTDVNLTDSMDETAAPTKENEDNGPPPRLLISKMVSTILMFFGLDSNFVGVPFLERFLTQQRNFFFGRNHKSTGTRKFQILCWSQGDRSLP